MKKFRLLALIMAIMMLFQGMPLMIGSAATSDTIVLYPEYPEKIERDYMYRIYVSQGGEEYEIPVYNSMRHTNYFAAGKQGTNSEEDRRFCQFSATPSESNPVTVRIVVNTDFSKYAVIPSSEGIASTVSGNEVTFNLTTTGQYVFRLNDNNLTNLAIFADAVETDAPSKGASNVIVYNKNNPAPNKVSSTTSNIIYYIEDWVDVQYFELNSNQKLYIAPGAVLNARVMVPDGQSNVTISGRGMLRDFNDARAYNAAGEQITKTDYNYLLTIGSSWYTGTNLTSNVTVEDIILFDAKGFNLALQGTRSVTADGIKIISNEISTDGVSIWASEWAKIRNSYIYVSDNIFVIDQAIGLKLDNLVVGSSIATFFPQSGIEGAHKYTNIDVFRSGTLFEPAGGFTSVIYGYNDPGTILIENLSAVDCVAPVNGDSSTTSKMGKFFSTYTSATNSSTEKAITFKNVTLPETDNSYYVQVGVNNAKAGNYQISLQNVYVGKTALTTDNVIFTDSTTSGKASTCTVTNDGTYTPVTRNTNTLTSSYTAYKIYTKNLWDGTKYYYYSLTQPYVTGGVIYVSAQAVADLFGFETYYDADDNSITLYDEDVILRATVGSTTAVHNDKLVTLDTAVQFKEEIMVPADFFTKTLGISITRDSKNILVRGYERAENLVDNGDFEDKNALESWTTINFARLTRSTVAHSGSYGLRFADKTLFKNTKAYQGAYQNVIETVLLNGAGVYEISFWAKCNESSVDLTDTSSYFISAFVGTGWMDSNTKAFKNNAQQLTTSWKQYKQQIVITEASGDNSMYNSVMYAAVMIKGAIDVSLDDFTFTKVSAVPSATSSYTMKFSDGTTSVNYGNPKTFTISGSNTSAFTYSTTSDYLVVDSANKTVSVAYPSNYERQARIVAKNSSGSTVADFVVTIPATTTDKHVLDYDCGLVVDDIYKAGETLNTSSFQLTNVKYNDGTIGTVDGSNATVDYDFSTEGEAVVTVTYDKKSVSYTTTVVDESLIKINVLGASIRLANEEYSAGIRFGATIAKDNIFDTYYPTTDEEKFYGYDENCNYQFGVIMLPKRLVSDGSNVVEMHKAGNELVLDILGTNVYAQDKDYLTFTGVLVGIPETKEDLSDTLQCAFYVRVRENEESEWVYTYSTKVAEDSYFSVAEKAYYSDYNYGKIENPTEEEKAIIEALADVIDFVEEDLWIDCWA